MTYFPAHLEPWRHLIRWHRDDRGVPATIEQALVIPAAETTAKRRREQALVGAQVELLDRLHRAGALAQPENPERS